MIFHFLIKFSMEKFLDRSENLVSVELKAVSSVKSAGFSKSILLGLNVILSSLLLLVLSLNTGDCRCGLKIILNGAIVDK